MDMHLTLQIGGVARRVAIDPRFGHVVNNDFVNYRTSAGAGALDLDAIWLGQTDPHSSPMEPRGIGKIGIARAAVANRVGLMPEHGGLLPPRSESPDAASRVPPVLASSGMRCRACPVSEPRSPRMREGKQASRSAFATAATGAGLPSEPLK